MAFRFYLRHTSFWKTLMFNFHYFPFRTAIKFPVLISKKVRLLKLKGRLHLGMIEKGIVKIGFFDNTPIFDYKKDFFLFSNEGEIHFRGKCKLGSGSKIDVESGAKLLFGKNFRITSNSSIRCKKYISFGDDCLISWNTQFLDGDYHSILIDGIKANPDSEISIGNHVWVCCDSLILKGTSVADGCVIGAGSVLCGKSYDPHCLIAGVPGIEIKKDIDWSVE